MNRKQESGNVLFLILLGVVMFALLSYSVARSSRVLGSMSQEDAMFAANAILRYGSDVRNAVDSMLTGGGTTTAYQSLSVANLSFTAGNGAGDVFGPNGGGVRLTVPELRWLDTAQQPIAPAGLFQAWFFPANVCVPAVGTGGTVTACNTVASSLDVVMILPYVRREICVFINQRLGVPVSGGPAPAPFNVFADVGNLWEAANTVFAGTFSTAAAQIIADGAGNYNAQHEGCIQGSGTPAAQPTGSYFYYKVLVER